MRSTRDERIAAGRAARTPVPRSAHADVRPLPVGRDAVEVLDAQRASRIEELVPVRYGRMAESPFAFFRGAAAVMALDLASTPSSGITVQASGDAHVANFGQFATPERRVVFDLNDFDETLAGRGSGMSSGWPPACRWRPSSG